MKKRIFGLLLALCLFVGLLPVTALADEAKPTAIIQMIDVRSAADKEAENSDFKLWSPSKKPAVKMNAGDPTKYFLSKEDDGNWYTTPGGDETNYNIKVEYPADGICTVTFKNATIKNAVGFSVGTYVNFPKEDSRPTYNCPFKIVLEGKNSITATHSSCGAMSFYTLGDVTITGSGSVELFANRQGKSQNSGNGGALCSIGNLTLDNTNISIEMNSAYYRSHAVAVAGGNLTVKGGKLNIMAKDATGKSEVVDCAISVTSREHDNGPKTGGNFLVTGGAVVSAAATPYTTKAIEIENDFVIEESTFEIGIVVNKREGVHVMNKKPTLKYANNAYTTYVTKSKLPKLSNNALVPAEDKYTDYNELEKLTTVSYFKVAPGGNGGSYGIDFIDTPTETTPVETKPVETKPVETKPVETKPAETKPVETKPAETKPAETKPAETKPAETKPAETKPAETKPAATKPADKTDKTDDEGGLSTAVLAVIVVLAVFVLGGGGFALYWFVIRKKK